MVSRRYACVHLACSQWPRSLLFRGSFSVTFSINERKRFRAKELQPKLFLGLLGIQRAYGNNQTKMTVKTTAAPLAVSRNYCAASVISICCSCIIYYPLLLKGCLQAMQNVERNAGLLTNHLVYHINVNGPYEQSKCFCFK